MNRTSRRYGFTLIEILVAMAMIVTIVSMVYGSYFAMSKSTQAYKGRMILLQEVREVLGQMALQIRCSYAGTADPLPQPMRTVSQQRKAKRQNSINYFSGNSDDPSGEILHLVTTKRFSPEQNTQDGLLEVSYKFDKHDGLLLLSQERFVGAAEGAAQKRIWQPIARNIRSVELEFFDGQQWLKSWNFKDKKKLPCAVKINITYEDKNYRQYSCGTIAYISCQRNQNGDAL